MCEWSRRDGTGLEHGFGAFGADASSSRDRASFLVDERKRGILGCGGRCLSSVRGVRRFPVTIVSVEYHRYHVLFPIRIVYQGSILLINDFATSCRFVTRHRGSMLRTSLQERK